MKRLILLSAIAAAVSGCAPGIYHTADDCWNDKECRREWRARDEADLRQRARHRHRYIHTVTHKRGKRDDVPELIVGRRDGPVCGGMVRATGEKATSQENAELFAWRIWQGEVAFRYGEAYIDFSMAKAPRKLCAPVSIADTVTGKLQQKLLGITHWRCQLEGIPCRSRSEVVPRED